MLRYEGDGRRLTLTGRFTIYHVAELLAFLRTLKFATVLEVDLAGVDEFDSAGVQLLLALQRELQRQRRQLRLVRHSSAVLDVFALYELAARFGDPVLMPVEGGA